MDTRTASVWVLSDVMPTFAARRGTWILKSILVLISGLRPRGVEKCVQSMLQLPFLHVLLWTFRSELTIVCSSSGHCRSRVFSALDDSHL